MILYLKKNKITLQGNFIQVFKFKIGVKISLVKEERQKYLTVNSIESYSLMCKKMTRRVSTARYSQQVTWRGHTYIRVMLDNICDSYLLLWQQVVHVPLQVAESVQLLRREGRGGRWARGVGRRRRRLRVAGWHLRRDRQVPRLLDRWQLTTSVQQTHITHKFQHNITTYL